MRKQRCRSAAQIHQCLCFRYKDNTLPLIPKSKAILCDCIAWFVSDLVGNPEDRFSHDADYMSLVVRKPVFGVSDLVRHKPGCAVIEDGLRLEISDLRRRGIHCTIRVAKTKALISFAVTAKLVCVFIFAYAHNEAHMGHDHMVSRMFCIHVLILHEVYEF